LHGPPRYAGMDHGPSAVRLEYRPGCTVRVATLRGRSIFDD